MLADCPSIWPENVLAHDAFRDLMHERPLGFGVEGLIPRQVIRDYAQDMGLEFRDLFWRVRVLDMHHRKLIDEKRREEAAREQREAERKNRSKSEKHRRR